jgi:hypothetical protein
MLKHLITICGILFFASNGSTQNLHRDSIVTELQILKSAVLKNDKEKVAKLFSFPITNTELKSKIEFYGEKEIKISALDKKAFEKYYSRIITAQLINFFKILDINSLKRTNKITNSFIPKTIKDKNKYTFELIIEKNTIKLHWNANPRDDIKMKEEEMPFEHSEEWHLKFLNGKLKFNNFFIAG